MVSEALYNVDLIGNTHTQSAIAARVSESMGHGLNGHTLEEWLREFRKLGGYVRVDGRGKHEREWILDEEDLRLQLLSWLKTSKRVTARPT